MPSMRRGDFDHVHVHDDNHDDDDANDANDAKYEERRLLSCS